MRFSGEMWFFWTLVQHVAAQNAAANLQNFASLANTALQIGGAIGDIKDYRQSNDPQYDPAHPASQTSPVLSGRTGGIAGLADSLSTCDPDSDGLCCLFPNYCHPNADCDSNGIPSSIIGIIGALPTCKCKAGYFGNGKNTAEGCVNIDECAGGMARCEQLCQDLSPGYGCGCHTGFHINFDGYSCDDDDECLDGSHMCSHGCINIPGSYTCSCPPGYALDFDGFKCLDINECLATPSPCDFHEYCINLPGSYECGCPDGWKMVGNSECVDIDECTEGVALNGFPPCALLGQVCSNFHGGFGCSCGAGFRYSSEPPRESGVAPLPSLNGWTAKQYSVNYARVMGESAMLRCEDIDECAGNQGLCPMEDSACRNLPGSYSCTCPPAYEFNMESGACEDVNECASDSHTCDRATETCRNLAGSYECVCMRGYELLDGICVDVDECAGSHGCTFACRNTVGSYRCICPDGFSLMTDGLRCQDIDEC
eukprot:Polyplicarium_translucidae@DN2462_c0_g2_i2.p1